MRFFEEYRIEYVRKQAQPESSGKWGAFYDWVGSFESAVVIIALLFVFLFRPVRVSGESMRETLQDGDWVAVSSISIGLTYGDIIVVNRKDNMTKPLIKRIIAMEGDTVDFDPRTNNVCVTKAGTNVTILLNEPYIRDVLSERHSFYDTSFPYTVPEDCVFVMGDNRNNSKDSRMAEVGALEKHYIMGKALFRIIPVGKFSIYNNYESDVVYGTGNR